MLGPGIICATVPVTMGYSIHSFRKAGDKGWALLALLVGAPMSLLLLMPHTVGRLHAAA